MVCWTKPQLIGDYKMLILHDVWYVTCRIVQTFMKWSLCLFLKLFTGQPIFFYSEMKFVPISETILLGSPYFLFWNEVCAHVWNYFTQQPIFWEKILHVFFRLSILNPSTCFTIGELAVLIYNIKMMLVINCKHLSSYRFPWFPWYFMWYCFFLWSWFQETKSCGLIFNCFFCISIHVNLVYGLIASIPVFSMSMWLRCNCFSAGSLWWCKYYYSSAFHDNSIYDCNLISEWLVWMQSLLYLSFCWCPVVE